MPVNELLQRMSASELDEWAIYWEEEPFGPRHEDLRSGIIASLFYNANRAKDTPALGPDKFIPTYAAPPNPHDEEKRTKAMIQALIASGAKVVRRT